MDELRHGCGLGRACQRHYLPRRRVGYGGLVCRQRRYRIQHQPQRELRRVVDARRKQRNRHERDYLKRHRQRLVLYRRGAGGERAWRQPLDELRFNRRHPSAGRAHGRYGVALRHGHIGVVAISGYDINYSTDEGYTWTRALSNQSGTSATIANADNAVDYEIAVSARNPVGNSAWVRTATVAGIDAPAAVTVFRHRNTTGSGPASYMDAGWTAVSGATGYDVNYILGGLYHYRAADNVTGTTHRIVDAMYYQSHQFVVAVRARNAHGPGPWTNSPPADETRTLTASNITTTGATLTLDTYSSTWYYKATSGPHSACSSGQTGITAGLTGLDIATSYTYTAYSDSGCSAALTASTTFTTQGVSISNLTQASSGSAFVYGTITPAAPFTTGSNGGGYTLSGVTVNIAGVSGSPGSLAVTLHTDSNGNPASGELATLSGSAPTGAGEFTYTCSGAGCSLNPNTKYHIMLAASAGDSTNRYQWRNTSATAATLTPTGNGWAYSASKSYDGSSWSELFFRVMLKVSATLNPTLAAASDTATTATLTISHHSGAWWYKGNQSGASCTPVAAGTSSASLSSLTSGTSYTYKAYDTSGCASANEIASLTFTQVTPGSRDSSKDITLASGNGNPAGVWSDGTTMWVMQHQASTVFAYKISDGSRDSAKDITTASMLLGSYMTADGTTMWISDLATSAKLYGHSITNKNADSSKDFTLHADNDRASGLYADGTTMWVHDRTDEKIYAYTISGGARDSGKDITLHTDNSEASGIWADSTTMWVADHEDDKLYAYRMSDGSRDSSKDYDNISPVTVPRGIWSNGTTMWIADDQDNKLYAYHAIGSQPSNTSASARLGSSQSAMVSSMTAPIPPQGTDAPLNPATAFASGFSGSPGQATGASAGNAAGLPGYVSSLTSAQSGGTQLKAGDLAGVAFTTGSHPDGYTLNSVTATLAAIEGEADLVWTLHELAGDTYGADSQPAPTARATLTGTAPTADEFTDLTYTCAGDGCALAPNTTYFVVAESVGSGVVSWAFIFSSATLSETTVPANNGWSLGHGHYSADAVTWTTFQDWQHTRLDFTPR